MKKLLQQIVLIFVIGSVIYCIVISLPRYKFMLAKGPAAREIYLVRYNIFTGEAWVKQRGNNYWTKVYEHKPTKVEAIADTLKGE